MIGRVEEQNPTQRRLALRGSSPRCGQEVGLTRRRRRESLPAPVAVFSILLLRHEGLKSKRWTNRIAEGQCPQTYDESSTRRRSGLVAFGLTKCRHGSSTVCTPASQKTPSPSRFAGSSRNGTGPGERQEDACEGCRKAESERGWRHGRGPDSWIRTHTRARTKQGSVGKRDRKRWHQFERAEAAEVDGGAQVHSRAPPEDRGSRRPRQLPRHRMRYRRDLFAHAAHLAFVRGKPWPNPAGASCGARRLPAV